MNCPIGLFTCEGCEYGKENLCDYPHSKKIIIKQTVNKKE